MKKLFYILLFVPLAFFGQENYSLSFDGIDDYVDLMFASELSFGDDNFSFMSSFKANEKKRQWLISNYQSPTNNDILFSVGTDVYDDELLIIYDIRSPGFSYTGVGSTDLFDGEFHTVSFVRNQDNFIVYIDGLVEIDTFHTIYSLTDASSFKIGYEHESYYDSYWSGYISETVFWDTSLSEQDVYSYSKCSYLITDSEPIAYWDFNEGEEETILYDLGAAQINGTIHGATYSEDVPENDCIEGCIDVNAYNFDQTAYTDDGSCEYSGCMNSDAINFDETATIDDEESCIYSQEYVHGLWNEVDDGAIEFNEAVASLSSLQQALDTWNTTIDLSAGWNMFGYGCPSSINVADGLSNHTESIIITKDNSGNVYMPEFGFNGIGDFTPGFGYQIKLTETIEGFSLCDWYVNDIPEDNIVSLQEENISLSEQNTSLQEELDSIYGCIDETACNYDSQASLDDGSCFNNDLGCGCNLPAAVDGFDCDGNEINQETCPYDSYFEYNPISNNYNIDSCITLIIEGCTDLLAENFNINANLEDGSCEYINGCNISIASNFNPLVTQNDGSCEGCTDSSAANFSSQIMIDDGSCYYHGCMNPTSENYNPIAVADDGSCIIYGCILEDFPNYNSAATIDNGSCDMNSIQVFGCTNNQFLEYNYLANIDNGTCVELVPYIGEYRESLGGVVFHIDESGYSGLVAHQTNIGSANLTLAIELCNDFVVLGYDDWYLPSSEEQGIMFDNIAYDYDEENINNFPGGWYWNTSYNQYGAAQPRWLGPYCYSCTWGADNPSNSYHVRPIRAF